MPPLPDHRYCPAAGPYGSLEMGGMFSVVKVRKNLARNDYRDPGWYQAPPGTVAYEWRGANQPAAAAPGPTARADDNTVNVIRRSHQH